jgi:hypothetical protein
MQGNTDETIRHENRLNYPVTEGDRIQRDRVARTLGGLRTRRQSTPPEADDQPEVTQAVALTQTSRYDDVMRALLFVPSTGRWLRASRHSSSSAWSQAEADWTVHEAGDTLVATGGDIERSPDEIEDEDEYAAGWLEIVAGDLSYDAEQGNTASISDVWELGSGNTIRLRDRDGREGFATFRLEDREDDAPTAKDLEVSDE